MGVIREGISTDSTQVGYLVQGEEIYALATDTVGDVLRVQFERGWVTVFSMGKELLELLPDSSAPEGIPPAVEGTPDSDEEDKYDDPSTPSKRVGAGLPAEELAKRRGWVLDVPMFKDLGQVRADAIAMALEARAIPRRTVVIEKGNVGEQVSPSAFFIPLR